MKLFAQPYLEALDHHQAHQYLVQQVLYLPFPQCHLQSDNSNNERSRDRKQKVQETLKALRTPLESFLMLHP